MADIQCGILGRRAIMEKDKEIIDRNYIPRGEGESRCPTCNRIFTSTWAFDRHRIGEHGVNRSCLSPWIIPTLKLDYKGRWRKCKMPPNIQTGLPNSQETQDHE
jgi:uncharacterized C2H2 Zn-finger protein